MEKSPETPPAIRLIIAPELEALGIKAKGAVIEGVTIKPKISNGLKKDLKTLIARLDVSKVLNSPVIGEYRRLHEQFDETDTPSGAEALLYYYKDKGAFPRINDVVAAYNMVAAETGLAIGVHDADKIQGNVVIRRTDGTERFTPMFGEPLPKVPDDRYAAVDDSREVLCWMEAKQCEKTKIQARKTENLFIYIQGNEKTPETDLEQTLQKICETIVQYCGGNYILLS